MTEHLSARQLLDRLVAFPTVSRDSNLPLVDWVEDYLNGQGIACQRMYDETQQKAAIIAHVGPQIEGGLVLSGHSDVVPIDGQAWEYEPFAVTQRHGRLYGRGTCDMKGFVALAIWALVEAHHRGVKRPLQLALSYDEELGCIGAPPLIEWLLGTLPKASAVIVGEPSMMKAVTGHKGGMGFHVHVRGFEVHSSIMHTGINAIMEGAKLIDWANRINDENRAAPVRDIDSPFVPPWTTLHVGRIRGGTAENITALDCHFGFGFRLVPGDSAEAFKKMFEDKVAQVQAGMQSVVASARIDVVESHDTPGLTPERDGEAELLVRRLTGDNATHVVSYGTEAGHFQKHGYSVVICGPGDIAQAHQPDEFLTVREFEAGQTFMRNLLDDLAK